MAYSTPNYDPQKAHEYYEKHKKLKGNRSTKGFSQEQKEYVKYGKAQLTEQRQKNMKGITNKAKESRDKIRQAGKEKNDQWREIRKSNVEKIRAEAMAKKERLREQTNMQVEALKRKMANMSPEQKAEFRARLSTTIQGLRSSLKAMQGRIDSKVKSDVATEGEIAKARIAEQNAKTKTAIEGDKAQWQDLRAQEWKSYEKSVDKLYEEARAHSNKKQSKKK